MPTTADVTMTVTIDKELQARYQAVAAPDEDWNAFITAALRSTIEQRERETARRQAARAEAQAVLNGPRRPAAEVNAEMRRKYNIPDLSHMTRDELADDAERIVAAMSPEVRAAMEREGLL